MISRFFGIMAAVLLAVGSLLSIREAGGPPSPMSVASADIQRSEHSTPRYSSKPIRDIQPIADRVLADNPETPGQAPSDFGEFDRESWRIVRLGGSEAGCGMDASHAGSPGGLGRSRWPR